MFLVSFIALNKYGFSKGHPHRPRQQLPFYKRKDGNVALMAQCMEGKKEVTT